MKKSGFYGMMLSAAVLQTACTDNDLSQQGEVPITLTTVLLGSDGGTRAGVNVQSTMLAQGEEFHATFSNHPSGVSEAKTVYTSNGDGTATPDAGHRPFFKFDGTSTTVNAYYGKSGGASGTQVTNSTTSFSVALDQSGDAAYKASDLMHATTTVEKSNPTGVLHFSHKMSKIIVNATLGEGVSSITGVYIVGGNRTIALSSDGACTLGATSDALSANSPLTMYTGSGVSVSCAALLPPQTITGDFLKVMTDRGAITFSLAGKAFAAGKSYVYNIVTTAAEIGHTTDITGWDEQNAVSLYNNGTDVLEGLKPVDLGLPSGIKWANMNVGARTETDYGQYFMWGNVPALPDEIGQVADKWYDANAQYRYTKYIESDYTTLQPEDDAAAVAYGELWRMPTYEEFSELAATQENANYEWEWQTDYKHSGHAGWLITYKGVTPNTSIFLPCAGFRGSYGEQYGGGECNVFMCFYWASTLGPVSHSWNGDDYGAACRFIGGGVSSDGSRSYGASVRAVYADYRSLTDVTTDDVGKVICSNGHIHNTVSAVVCGGSASGIIAYVGDAGSADKSSGSSSYKGLALALYDYGGSLTTDGTTCQWYTVGSGTCITEGQSLDVSTAIGSSGDWGKGIDNTNRLATAECGNGHTHAAAQNATNFSDARPTGASQWFLPTMYQWNLMVKAMCNGSTDLTNSTNNDYMTDQFNVKITAAGGRGVNSNSYWSSVEYRTDRAWVMGFHNGYAITITKTGACYVRAAFAF